MIKPGASEIISEAQETSEVKPGDSSLVVLDAVREKACENCEEKSSVYLFRMIFQNVQRPDKVRQVEQVVLAVLLTVVLVAQVIWAMCIIPRIIFDEKIISSGNLPFLSLLVTAILGEVVAMAFVVVRFVFRSPVAEVIDILKDLVKRDSSKDTKN